MLFAVLTAFVLSVPFAVLNVDAQPPGQGSATLKTPAIIMKFCENAATTMQDCDEKYEQCKRALLGKELPARRREVRQGTDTLLETL